MVAEGPVGIKGSPSEALRGYSGIVLFLLADQSGQLHGGQQFFYNEILTEFALQPLLLE